jgi:Family of unknown function (DUF6069)
MTSIQQTPTSGPASVTSGARRQPGSLRGTRRTIRAGAVAAATLTNGLLWLAAAALGVDFVLSDSVGTVVIGLGTTLVATLIFGLLGWGTLAVLERLTVRAATVWTVLASLVAVVSLVPIYLEGATTGTKVALALIHLAVAAVLVPAMRINPKPSSDHA